jgi:hypothetical protein
MGLIWLMAMWPNFGVQVRLRLSLDSRGLVSLSRKFESTLSGWDFGTNQVCHGVHR